MVELKRFWVRFWTSADDYRPLIFPPIEGILGWWCSGTRDRDVEESCIIVWIESENQDTATQTILKHWPEFLDDDNASFQTVPLDWKPSDRFAVSEWSSEFKNKNDK